MIDYKYVVFDVDVMIPSTKEILYHKGQFYKITEVQKTFDDKFIVKTKYLDGWNVVTGYSKLLTLNEVRRMKLETLKRKI